MTQLTRKLTGDSVYYAFTSTHSKDNCACFFRFLSVTKNDFPSHRTELPLHHHRTLRFCTPVMDSGGCVDTPLGLSVHTQPLYAAGPGAPDSTAGVLAESLPVAWTGPGGVDHGRDLSYKSDVTIHQDLCRWSHHYQKRLKYIRGKITLDAFV